MNRYGWMVLFLVGCGSQHHGARVHERGVDASGDYRSGEGFQVTRWGMGREEIRGLFPSVRATSRGDLVAETEIDERPVRVFFLFTDGRLGSVFVRFATPGDLQKDHRSMVKLLASKYGRPTKDGISRGVSRYRDSIDLASLLARALPPEVAGTSSGGAPAPTVVAEEAGGEALMPVVRPEDSEEMARTLQSWPGDVAEGGAPEELGVGSEGAEPEVPFSPHGYVKVATWDEREMAIQLLGYSAPRGALLTLHYESHKYSRAIRNELNRLLAELREEQGSEL
ncbi:hypothetical protein MYSTI_07763 [Myxococcus stipitatus DSM 14675]|uniref:Uncharacterized protein n=2 Tax=Myxococcus stipitatus TaxID=83455 RepID=L7UMC8_MYXSD|nr:hypothetical protein MYSTI_07763 [Myxococcus stipitatus DSM 14675]